MGQEIERKFLLRDETWKTAVTGIHYHQGYLGLEPARTVRVRLAGEHGFLTIKGLLMERHVPSLNIRFLLTMPESCWLNSVFSRRLKKSVIISNTPA